MNWIVGTLAALVAFGVSVGVVGAFLPLEHVASMHASYQTAPSDLYASVREVVAHPQWRTGVRSVDLLGTIDGQMRYREVSSDGPITFRVLTDEPAARFVVEIADATLAFGGTWTFQFTPGRDGTDVRITEHGFVSNVFFRALARFVFGHTSRMDTYLRDLGRRFGETVQPKV